jgi:hypothetical protein
VRNDRRYCVLLVTLLLAPAARPCRAGDAPRAEFLEGDAARKVLADDSDGYFGLMSPLDVAAKTGKPLDDGMTAEQRVAEAKRRHADAVLEWTAEEREALTYYVSRVDLREKYPLLAALPWRFVKVSSDLGSGLPHTRADCIILAEPVLARLAPAPKDPDALTTRRALSLLLHEQLHVLQRKDPRRFDDLYTRVWKFRRVESIDGGEKLNGRVIINPDAPRNEWVHPAAAGGWVWPLMVFRDGTDLTNASLMRMQQAAVDVAPADGKRFKLEAGEPELVPLESVEGFMEAYFPTAYCYHPNEASADLFATLVSFDAFGAREAVPEDQRDRFDAALEPLRKWVREHLRDDKAPAEEKK